MFGSQRDLPGDRLLHNEHRHDEPDTTSVPDRDQLSIIKKGMSTTLPQPPNAG
jgi:hypothetical protein